MTSTLEENDNQDTEEDFMLTEYDHDAFVYKIRKKDKKRKSNKKIYPSMIVPKLRYEIKTKIKENSDKNLLENIHSQFRGKLKISHIKKELRNISCCEQIKKQKDNNIEERLHKLGLKRLNTYPAYNISQRFLIPTYDNFSTIHNHKYALKSEDASKLSLEKQKVRLIMALQYRDITPEDYELLLHLDNSVSPRVATKDTLNTLEAVTVKNNEMMEHCIICVEDIRIEEKVIQLPKCQHIFHELCIVTWLTNASDKCPFDNICV